MYMTLKEINEKFPILLQKEPFWKQLVLRDYPTADKILTQIYNFISDIGILKIIPSKNTFQEKLCEIDFDWRLTQLYRDYYKVLNMIRLASKKYPAVKIHWKYFCSFTHCIPYFEDYIFGPVLRGWDNQWTINVIDDGWMEDCREVLKTKSYKIGSIYFQKGNVYYCDVNFFDVDKVIEAMDNSSIQSYEGYEDFLKYIRDNKIPGREYEEITTPFHMIS